MSSQRQNLWRRSAVALIIVGLIASACGSSSSSATPSSATTSSAATSAPATSSVTTATGSASPVTSAPFTSPSSSATISGPGVTATTITIGQIASVTGPAPGIFQNADQTMDAFVAYVNSQGGIDGRKLVVIHKDDAYDCVTYTNVLKSLSTKVFAVVGTFSAQDACGSTVLKQNPTLPDIQAAVIASSLYSLPNTFTPDPNPGGDQTTGYLWIKNKYAADISHFAVMYSALSPSGFTESSKAAESVGYKIVYSRGVGGPETNFTSDVLRMKADKVKIVDLSDFDAPDIAIFLEEAAQQHLNADAYIAPLAYDANFFPLLGSNKQVASNVIAPLLYPMYLGQDAATNPELATLSTWLNKTHPGVLANGFGTPAWAAGVLFLQGVQQAGSGGAPVTRASLIKALDGVHSFNAKGLLPTSDPGDRKPATCEVIVGVQNEKFVRLDPPTSGFECNGTYLAIPANELS